MNVRTHLLTLSLSGLLMCCLGMTAGCGEPSEAQLTCKDLVCTESHRTCTEAFEGEDAFCGGCTSGFWDQDGQCIATTACADDEYETTAPTPTSDRVCAELTACAKRGISKRGSHCHGRSHMRCTHGLW